MAREKTKCMTSIGGQALIEGIMMRGPQKTAVAVRLPDNTIETEYLEIKTLRDKYPLFRAPLLRGIAGFIDSLSIGYRALMLSAEKSDEETGEEEMSRFDAWIDRKFGDKAMKAVTVTGTVLGVALAVLLFFVLPTWIYNLIGGAVPFMQENQVLRSLIEGVMRLAIFIGYVILCSQVEGVGRVAAVFQEDRLCPQLNAVQNVTLVLPGAESQYKEQITSDFQQFGMNTAALQLPARRLSGGQKRRVALLRALWATSDTLLLDEPFTGMDPDTLQRAAALLRQRCAGKPVLLATHDESAIRVLGWPVVELEKLL